MKSAITQKYTDINFSEDRTWRERDLQSKNVPWKFQNLLPYEINVYVFTPDDYQVKLDLIGTIQAQGTISATKSKSGMKLKGGDEIHILRPVGSNSSAALDPSSKKPLFGVKSYEIARPVWLFGDSRTVIIGDIVYEDRVAFTNGVDISHDMIGLRIHNHLTMGIDIYYKGLKIAQVSGDDGTSFMAGSPNSVYLNNERFGFNIDDEISFVFTYDQKPYAKIRLIDNYTSDIIIGETTQKFVPAIQDMFGYRVNEPNINGLRYYGVNAVGNGGVNTVGNQGVNAASAATGSSSAYANVSSASGSHGPGQVLERRPGNLNGNRSGYENILVSQRGIKL